MNHRIPTLIAACLVVTSITGCETLMKHWPHNLQAHRLWHLNRQPDTQRNVYYSVSDKVPVRELVEDGER